VVVWAASLRPAFAQDAPAAIGPTRLAIYQAEDRRAQTANDLAILRSGSRAGDPQTVRVAVRALGRLERPSLIPDILPLLRHALPEVRAEAANALGQALQGLKRGVERTPPVRATASRVAAVSPVDTVIAALVARLTVEAEGSARGAISETLGRIPVTAEQVQRVDEALVAALSRENSIDGRLGIASGFEALARLHRRDEPPSDGAILALRALVSLTPPGRLPADPSRTVRVRRLALEALVTAEGVDAATLQLATRDPDPQVRRLAMRAVTADTSGGEALTEGLTDAVPMVRIEALRAMRVRGIDALCRAAVIATGDTETHVVLFALDQLAGCGASTDAVAELERVTGEVATSTSHPRAWHRAAHALVALATAAPARAAGALRGFTGSSVWQLRMYAARAAGVLKDRSTLEALARDEDDNVREAAVDGLVNVAGHDADPLYIASLTRKGHQVLRAAASALADTPAPDAALPALKAALQRLRADGHDNSHDARAALEKTLATLGGLTPAQPPRSPRSDLNADDLRRFSSVRARVTMRGLGNFDLMLFTSEAPATVLRFVHLAQSGYYNGLTFHRVVPNFVIQGGSPGANEYVGDAAFMRDEVGLWPHVRGAVGISTRGRDTGDAQIFIDLVDNPRLNHDYTVFAQVLSGIEIVDQVLEGDIIETIEILAGPS
jgi:peptidyl-prolyl cis-trans isomerase B (cyclophilin B)